MRTCGFADHEIPRRLGWQNKDSFRILRDSGLISQLMAARVTLAETRPYVQVTDARGDLMVSNSGITSSGRLVHKPEDVNQIYLPHDKDRLGGIVSLLVFDCRIGTSADHTPHC
jgi:hypothetical protein